MRYFRSAFAILVTWLICFSHGLAAEEIILVGTNDGEAIFQAVADAFTRSHPDVSITLPEDIGSTGAIKLVSRGDALLGRVARDIQEHETHYGLTYFPFAKTPVVFFTHRSAGVQGLTVQQILNIYSGTVTNWQEVGGSDVKIRVVLHEEGDSNREVLEDSFSGLAELSITSKSKTVHEDEEAIELAEDKEGVIAYGTYADAAEADVVVLSIDGREPLAPDYPYASILGFVFKDANFTGTLRDFVEFATSDAAREVIEDAGGIPLNM